MSRVMIFIPATILLVISCGRIRMGQGNINDDSLVTRFGDTSRYAIHLDSISIPLSPGFESNYKVSVVYKGQDDLLYYAYNDSSHSIDVFSVLNSRIVTKIKLEREGVRGFRPISGLYVNSPDSIFVFDNSFIGLIDSRGNAIRRWPVNGSAATYKRFFSDHDLYVAWPQVFDFEKSEDAFYILFKGSSMLSNEKEIRNSFRDRDFLLRYDLKEKKPLVVPVYYPKAYESAYYGNMTQPDVAFVRDARQLKSIVYIFPVLPNIYAYDLSTGNGMAYGGSSTLSSNAVSRLDWKDFSNDYNVLAHFHRNVNFYRIFYDSVSKYLYRFHFGAMDSGDHDYKNVYLKKKLYVTVFDSSFHIIREEQLHLDANNDMIPLSGSITGNELYIPVKGKDLSKLRFVRMKLLRKEMEATLN